MGYEPGRPGKPMKPRRVYRPESYSWQLSVGDYTLKDLEDAIRKVRNNHSIRSENVVLQIRPIDIEGQYGYTATVVYQGPEKKVDKKEYRENLIDYYIKLTEYVKQMQEYEEELIEYYECIQVNRIVTGKLP